MKRNSYLSFFIFAVLLLAPATNLFAAGAGIPVPNKATSRLHALPAPPPDATLSQLTISSGTLSPGFASATVFYETYVTHATTSIKITPTTHDPAATVKVNGVTVASGSPSSSIPLATGFNTITTVVTAVGGSVTDTYTLILFRELSTIASLSGLALDNGTLSPVFAAATTSYTASVTNDITSVKVTPTTTEGHATVTVNGTAVTSGTASGVIALNVGPNTITTTVTAEDESTTKTYTITITRGFSSDARLKSIGLRSPFAMLTSVSGPGHKNYTATVNYSGSTITVLPVTNDAGATVTVNGSAVTSGNQSDPIPLSLGANTITVVCTAQDGTTTFDYIITVTRLQSSNAKLSSINIRPYAALTEVAGPGFKNYTASVSFSKTTAGVLASTSDSLATFTVNGAPATSGTVSNPVPLNVGDNTITVVVTAQDGTTATYIITVTRLLSSDVQLSSINVKPYAPLTEVVGPGDKNFAGSVSNDVSSAGIVAVTGDSNATFTVNGAPATSGTESTPVALNVGDNTFTVVVTAQDGVTTGTYIVTLTRAAPGGGNIPNQPIAKPVESSGLNGEDVVVHQGVSPNGDGTNDFLVIDGITAHPDNKLTITSRNGALVFEAKGYDNQSKVFNGRSSKTGAMQSPGTYFYSLDYNVKGVSKHKTGVIVLKY